MDPTPSAQLASAPQGSPLFTLARDIDARLRERSTIRKRSFALDAFDLAECKRLELFRLLGYSSVTSYARSVNGFGSSKTSSLIQIAEACAQLPLIRDAFLAGQLDWCAAREIVKAATPANEAEWLETAGRLTVSELKAVVQQKDPIYRRLLELSSEELGWVEAVADGVRREGGPFALGKAIAEACRRLVVGEVAGEAARIGGPGFRVVIHQCAVCEKATRETTQGPVAVSPEDFELVSCDAEVLDIRNGPAKLTRTAPPKIHNFVMARDKGCCVVPGCQNRTIHFHHEDGWRSGHNPSRCFGLCDSHHRARHRGYLRVEGSMPDLCFFLADGTYLGRAGDEHKATEAGDSLAAPTSEPAPPRVQGEVARVTSSANPVTQKIPDVRKLSSEQPSRPSGIPLAGGSPNPVNDAVKALRTLQIKSQDAKTRVQRVLQLDPGRLWEAGDLVREVLRGLPSAG